MQISVLPRGTQILPSFLVTDYIILPGLSSRILALYKEQAVKLSTTLQKNGLLSVEVNSFLNSIRNFMFLRPVGFETTIRGAFPWNTSKPMRLAGVDVQTHWKISKQWQHDFTLPMLTGKTSQTRSP
jgi:hypothetical protein